MEGLPSAPLYQHKTSLFPEAFCCTPWEVLTSRPHMLLEEVRDFDSHGLRCPHIPGFGKLEAISSSL